MKNQFLDTDHNHYREDKFRFGHTSKQVLPKEGRWNQSIVTIRLERVGQLLFSKSLCRNMMELIDDTTTSRKNNQKQVEGCYTLSPER
jgi:hypothetical protein